MDLKGKRIRELHIKMPRSEPDKAVVKKIKEKIGKDVVALDIRVVADESSFFLVVAEDTDSFAREIADKLDMHREPPTVTLVPVGATIPDNLNFIGVIRRIGWSNLHVFWEGDVAH